mgnify:CR=1 FL=1
MNPKRAVTVSKFLSKVLRHEPEAHGLVLEPGGWVSVDDRIAAVAKAGISLTRSELDAIVAGSEKQRFAVDGTGDKIRANQGHSVEVDLQLAPATPPAILFHGTVAAALPAIREGGLQKMARQHVHLSADIATATKVGSRRGKPVILEIDAAAMVADGFAFFLSANGVWLTDAVPAQYLRPHTA